ncbi:Auxin efflux carrier family protein isoform 2 [Theobroma cacao]|uniref:Auxin efflux carrier family protein isoform 2 n=1 Tax=Theobroma cacao TaxID=3641 RepID=A0A061FPG0_THECC|nr:Auxin efflux carrier family protein isoform 2 [Theobroma cacao]
MGFLDMFVVALMPVLKVLLVTAVGLLLAMEKIDLLGPEARNYLNKIVFYVLSPSLLVSNLADTITYNSVVTLWFMPLNILLTFIIGSALGLVLIKVTKTPEHLRGIVIGCCSAGNLGNLLLILVPAVCEQSNSPFGDSSTCSTNAVAYASLSMAVAAIYTWSYSYAVVSAYAIKSPEHKSTHSSEEAPDPSSDSCTEALLPSSYSQISEESSVQVELPLTNSGERTKVLVKPCFIAVYASFAESLISLVFMCLDLSASMRNPVFAFRKPFVNLHKMSFWKNIVQCVKSIMSKIDLKMVFAPSTIAAIIGFIFGIVSPIRKVLIDDSAPLHVIYTSAAFIGEAAIPCMTLIMGANLLKGCYKLVLAGLKRSEVNLLVIIGVVAVRNIFLPLLGIGVTKAAYHFGMAGSDSLYQFVLMLQYAVPPAFNVGMISLYHILYMHTYYQRQSVMTQLFQRGQGETSIIMLWTYAVASISLTLWSTLFMSLVA